MTKKDNRRGAFLASHYPIKFNTNSYPKKVNHKEVTESC